MWLRSLTGIGALGLFGWRVQDPKASYGVFYDISNWMSSFIISGEGMAQYLRNFINLIVVDQADGFLFGIAVATLISVVLWPVRFTARKTWGLVRRKKPEAEPAEPEEPAEQPLKVRLDRGWVAERD